MVFKVKRIGAGAMIFAVGSAKTETGPLLKLMYGMTNLVESTLLVIEIFLTIVNTWDHNMMDKIKRMNHKNDHKICHNFDLFLTVTSL